MSGCLGYEGDFDRGYQVDEQTLDQVKVGETTKPQALALMGTPSTTSTVGGDAWYYIGQKMSRALAFMPAKMTDQNVLAIYFDKSGKVDAHRQLRHEGRQGVRLRLAHDADRRPEPDFLRNMMTGLFRFSLSRRRGRRAPAGALDGSAALANAVAAASSGHRGRLRRSRRSATRHESASAGRPPSRSTFSCESMQAPQPLIADTARHQSSKSSFGAPGLAMTFIRNRAGIFVYSVLEARCTAR